jgi:hypothetical protein
MMIDRHIPKRYPPPSGSETDEVMAEVLMVFAIVVLVLSAGVIFGVIL